MEAEKVAEGLWNVDTGGEPDSVIDKEALAEIDALSEEVKLAVSVYCDADSVDDLDPVIDGEVLSDIDALFEEVKLGDREAVLVAEGLSETDPEEVRLADGLCHCSRRAF